MKKVSILRRFLSGALAVCLCVSLAAWSVPTAYATSVNELQDQADDLEAEAKDIKSELSKLKKQEKSKLEEKELLEQEIAVITNQIKTSQELLVLKEEELVQAQAEEAEYYELFCQRFRDMEESRTISIWSILFGSASFSDFLDRLIFVNEVVNYDNEIYVQLQAARQAVADAKAEIETTQAELESQQAALEEEEAAIDAVLQDLEDQIEEYQDELDSLQDELDKLEDQIAAQTAPPSVGNVVTGSGALLWPTTSRRITSYFGNRDRPTAGASTNHKGIDIGASKGTPIYAADGGTVVISTYSKSAGYYIKIDHGNGMSTVYMHCSALYVKVGATVAKGQTIAAVGSTGYSTGPHLHFGVIVNGSYVNPLNYVSP